MDKNSMNPEKAGSVAAFEAHGDTAANLEKLEKLERVIEKLNKQDVWFKSLLAGE